uniref:RING-H2 finger protein ATL7-like n=1 Tax=Erigeron canadensis TaxID=72917 RepID=UPI001CB8B79B|nr:RING-H2 finger protein ATL7-like [Erigeron canadensis]
MFSKSTNLVTTVIGFAMSATFIVFVCARLVCGRFRRYESRQLFEIDSRVDLERQEHRVVGLEPAMVAAIPTMKFDREAFASMEDAQCTICLGEYQEKEVLRIMPKCGHSFHLSCIDLWLRKQSTCPVCRLSVIAPSSPEISREISMELSRQWLLPHTGQGSSQSQSENRAASAAGNVVEAGTEAER